MAFYRQQIEALQRWKNEKNRKPLVLRGARQVGKTTLVNSFAKTYAQFIALNLEKQKDKLFFENYTSAESILQALTLDRRLKPIDKFETLLFIDEIQEKPEAIALLRYFYEDIPNLHVIAAGSLLEHAMSKVKSFPVGRVEYLYLFPMSFKEFLWAHDMHALVDILENPPVQASAHHVVMEWFHKYAMIGGMPEVIKSFIEIENLNQLPKIYESIWASYRDDVSKYAKNQTEEKVIAHIMKTAPFYMDSRVTFQGFGKSNYRSREVGESFRALDDAKIIQLIYPSTSLEYPIVTDFRKSPRLQFLDTGLLNHALNIQAQMIEINDLSTSFKGAILPHLITQEIISLQDIAYQKPHFWVRQKKDAQAEVDLIYPFRGLIIPIEIKSGKVGKMRSLHQFVNQSPHAYAVRLYAGEFSIEQHKTPSGKPFYLMNLPYYLGMFIEEYLTYFLDKFNKYK
jgi:predicted AAA+ superfamily ATPase